MGVARSKDSMAFFTRLSSLMLLFTAGTSYLYYKEPELEDTSTCPGKPNSLDPWKGEPTLVKTVQNGSLYTAGDGDDQLFGNVQFL